MEEMLISCRQAKKEPLQEVPRYRQDQGPQEEQGLNVSSSLTVDLRWGWNGRNPEAGSSPWYGGAYLLFRLLSDHASAMTITMTMTVMGGS